MRMLIEKIQLSMWIFGKKNQLYKDYILEAITAPSSQKHPNNKVLYTSSSTEVVPA